MSDTYMEYVYAAYAAAGCILATMTLISFFNWQKIKKKEKIIKPQIDTDERR